MGHYTGDAREVEQRMAEDLARLGGVESVQRTSPVTNRHGLYVAMAPRFDGYDSARAYLANKTPMEQHASHVSMMSGEADSRVRLNVDLEPSRGHREAGATDPEFDFF
jgi:hypothetical protein